MLSRPGTTLSPWTDDSRPSPRRRAACSSAIRRWRADGLKDEVDNAVRRGTWKRVRRGAYVEPELLRGASDVDLHRLLVHAVVAASQSDPVVSGVSAAVMHGLDLWDQDLTRVQLTHPGSRRESRVTSTTTTPRSDDDEIVVVDGLRVTSVARTAIDVARVSKTFEAGVITLDSALRFARTTPSELTRTAEPARAGRTRAASHAWCASPMAARQTRARRRLRVTYARPAFHRASRSSMLSAGPVLLAITDLAVLEHKTLLELDGRMKYGIDGQDPSEQVYREKLRQDDLRELGHEVTRFSWVAAGDADGRCTASASGV